MKMRSVTMTASLLLALLCSAAVVQAAPILGATGRTFGVLAGQTVTNTGATFIDGRLGVSPGSAITGDPSATRTVYHAGATPAQGQADIALAYAMLEGLPCDVNLSGKILGTSVGAITLTPGVYCFNTGAQLTGILTLDSQGDPDGVWVFQMGTTLIVAEGAMVVMTPNSNAGNVFWKIGSSATVGTNADLKGNVIALTSVTLNTSATVDGRVFARNGSVTMDTNTVGVVPFVASNPAIKVVGTGAIAVPSPNDLDPRATGTGRANFQFNVSRDIDGGPVTGYLDYENLVRGVEVRGPVRAITVLQWKDDGAPRSVLFSGVCANDLPQCNWVVTVEEDAAPRGRDQFGISVNGTIDEVRSQRTARCSPLWTACRINITP